MADKKTSTVRADHSGLVVAVDPPAGTISLIWATDYDVWRQDYSGLLTVIPGLGDTVSDDEELGTTDVDDPLTTTYCNGVEVE